MSPLVTMNNIDIVSFIKKKKKAKLCVWSILYFSEKKNQRQKTTGFFSSEKITDIPFFGGCRCVVPTDDSVDKLGTCFFLQCIMVFALGNSNSRLSRKYQTTLNV